MLKSKWFRWVMWSIAIFLIGWTFTHLPVASIVQSISTLTWSQWVAWLCVNAFIIVLGTRRWHVFLTMLKADINFTELLIIRQAGQAVSFITPGPQFGGEPLQVLWLCRSGSSLEKALLSIGLDRFYELWINFFILFLCVSVLLFIPGTPFASSYPVIAGLFAGAAVLVGIIWLLIRQPAWMFNRLQQLFTRWAQHPRLNKIRQSWQSINKDLRIALRTQKSVFIRSIFISLMAWVALLGELALLLNFVDVKFDVAGFLLILIAMRLALLLPIPGGIGTLEASVFWSFQYLNFSATAAIAFIALMRLRDVIILLFGLYCLRRADTKSLAANPTVS